MTASMLIDLIRSGDYRLRSVGSGAPWLERRTRLGWVRARAASHIIRAAADAIQPHIDGGIKTWSKQ